MITPQQIFSIVNLLQAKTTSFNVNSEEHTTIIASLKQHVMQELNEISKTLDNNKRYTLTFVEVEEPKGEVNE